jgi:lipoprotein-releasing system permease protein
MSEPCHRASDLTFGGIVPDCPRLAKPARGQACGGHWPRRRRVLGWQRCPARPPPRARSAPIVRRRPPPPAPVRIESFLGLRFLRSPRQTRSISIVTWISAVGVMLGVTALIVTISVMNGFRENLVLAVTGTMAHVRVQPARGEFDAAALAALREKLAGIPQVQASAPYLARQGFLRLGDEFRAILLRGIDPALEGHVSELPRFVQVGGPQDELVRPAPGQALAGLAYPPPAGQRAGIVLGRPLAAGLHLHIGDELEVISTAQRITPIGPVPLIKRFRLVGVFETGLSGVDEVTAYLPLALAQKLYRMEGEVSGVSLRVRDAQDIDGDALRRALPGYRVQTWAEQNRNIFQVMRLEKLGVFLILTLIIVVAFFNIIASLIMLVLEKRRAIATLKALGASDALVRRVFFMQGVWIGIVGTLAGLGLGLAACWALATFNLVPLPEGVFPLARRLPVRIEPVDLALITGSSFLICLLVTLYPASAAARTRPIENLRNE